MAYIFSALPADAPVGSKASTLARLYQRYPVPPGFIIPVTGFSGDDLTPEEWTQVQELLARLRQAIPGITFAVRSSALGEDSALASFAGEFETVLDVETDQAVHDAIRRVRQSAQTARVQAYSQSQGMSRPQEVAVIVQHYIRADYAGVLFTADPITGDLMHMTGNMVHGANDKLVSGEANAQPFTFDRASGKYSGPSELSRFARTLYRLGEKLDQEGSAPQDIEWVIARDRIFIVQARPITSLRGFNPVTGEWNDTLLADFLWSNGNGAEIPPQVMPLLTATVGALWGQGYGEQFSARYGASGVIGGRSYFNITVQIAGYAKLPGMSAQRLMQFVGQWWGPLPEDISFPSMPLSLWFVISRMVPTYLRSMRNFGKFRARIPEFVDKAPSWCRDMRQRIGTITDGSALAALWRDEIKPFYCFGTTMAGAANSDTRLRLEAKLRKLVGEADADMLISNLGGDGFIASLGPVVGLQKVARGEMSREAYLDQYGHRSPNEFNLIFPQPVENPAWLDEQLKDLELHPVDVDALLNRQRANFAAAWDRFAARYPRQVESMRRQLDEAARFARQREAARSEITRVMGVIRTWALKAAELTGVGEDIFHLTIDEVLGLLAGDTTPCQYLPARRQTYERYCALPPYPPVICGRFDPFAWAADPNHRSDVYDAHKPPAAADGSTTITGFAGSAGVVEGRVRLVETPEAGHLLQNGEILVTMTTNVGWTPLFPRAAAIVTDVGAPLSHAAIVARELGVPAVVGCRNATSRLRTGDRVRVDGLRGTVEILET